MSLNPEPGPGAPGRSPPPARVFAVVPAAGHSRRMGQPKLLLNINGRTVIRGLVNALCTGGTTVVYVLVRESDVALQSELATTAARVVLTAGTPDMRASVEVLLEAVQREQSPTPRDAWLLAPADHPLLESAVISALLAARRSECSQILVPVYAGRRGHPTCFSWDLAQAVAGIPEGAGLNRLVRDHPELVCEIAAKTEEVLLDLDTPADLDRLQRS
ncbi:MAG: nucleotidyltransferase family protein [Planctomycetaceae bacterium]